MRSTLGHSPYFIEFRKIWDGRVELASLPPSKIMLKH